MGGGTHACSTVPILLPDVQPALGASCLGAQSCGRPRAPTAAAFAPAWIRERHVSLAAAVCPVCSCSPSSLPPLPPPPSGFVSCTQARRGDPPTCSVKIPGCPEVGQGRAWRGFSQQCLSGVGVPFSSLCLPVGFTSGPLVTLQEAGGAAGAPGVGRRPEAVLAAPAATEPLVPSWVSGEQGGAGGSSLVRVRPSSLFLTLPLVRVCIGEPSVEL